MKSFYELFDFLDFFQVYEIFSNLNQRFENLLIDFNLIIKIKLSLISKSILNHFYRQIIMSNKHLIKSFDLSNPFIIDTIFSSTSILSKCIHLANLVIHDIKSDYLNELLIHLLTLPCLCSLVIDCLNHVKNQDVIYCQIFRLPLLKYYKLSMDELFNRISTTEFSSIEYLFITNILRVDQLNGLLSYVNQLHYLSISLSNQWNEKHEAHYSSGLHHLTHVDFNIQFIRK
jgi:hypothetical protein